MSDNIANGECFALLALVIGALYNLCLFAGFAYLVEIYQWNVWWMVAPFMLMFTMSSSKKNKEKNETM